MGEGTAKVSAGLQASTYMNQPEWCALNNGRWFIPETQDGKYNCTNHLSHSSEIFLRFSILKCVLHEKMILYIYAWSSVC